MGHAVEIREAGPVAGGMIHFGIPAYRMPREELNAEIKRIENIGVTITLNHRVEDVLAEKEAGGFDAVFVAVGAHISKKIDIPTRDAGKILDAVSFLSRPTKGRRRNSAAASRFTAAAIPRWMLRAPPNVWARQRP